jgi:uncharacterized protein YjiS (DUF1127 family)
MTRTDSHSGFGALFWNLAASNPPVQGMPTGRPGGESPPRIAVRPGRRQHLLIRALDTLETWSERTRRRRELMRLDDHLLRDIGITRADAIAEASKPFWRA